MNWCEEELKDIDLGDKRLDKRCIKLLSSFSNQPNKSIPANCRTWSETIAAYRFLSNDKVTPKKIMAPHLSSLKKRAKAEKVILAIQDTSELNYSNHSAMEGIGPLSREKHRGLLIHPTLLFTPDKLCLGILDIFKWHRDYLKGEEKKGLHYNLPIEQKESNRWLESYRKTQELADEFPESTVINIADREGDIYEIFLEHNDTQSKNKCEYLIRACQNRCVMPVADDVPAKLQEQVSATPVLGELKFQTPSGRGKKSRTVRQSVQATELILQPPKSRRPRTKMPTVKVTAILAKEIDVPTEEEPVTWLLLTSLKIKNFTQAVQMIDYYLCRWQIELFFKILKSGCTIEEIHLQKEDSINAYLVFYMIISWRILFLTMLGRSTGEISCNAVFEEYEWQAIYVFAKRKSPPEKPPLLKEIIIIIASLGGFLNRKQDGYPGPKVMWIGLQRSIDIITAWNIFNESQSYE